MTFSIFSLIGAVGIVAVQAVLAHGRVLPEEGTALLGVAGVAVLVDRGLQQHLVVGGAVRVVAARALQLALAHGHVAGAEQLGLLLQVAAGAQDHLRLAEERLGDDLALGVRVVAGHAGDVPAVVRRAHPVLLVALVVALHADRRRIDRAQGLEGADLRLVAAAVHVRLAGAVAALAALRVPGVRRALEGLGRVLVADHAGIHAHIARFGPPDPGLPAPRGRGARGDCVAPALAKPSESASPSKAASDTNALLAIQPSCGAGLGPLTRYRLFCGSSTGSLALGIHIKVLL